MIRTITGFHLDEEGDWVAELDCLHGQHVRHRPPFQERPWVLDEDDRTRRIGSVLDCPLCDRAELPSDLVHLRTLGPFDEVSLPEGLLRTHRVAIGQWGRLKILEGAVEFHLEVLTPLVTRLGMGEEQAIPPVTPHRLVLLGPARLTLELWGRRPQETR